MLVDAPEPKSSSLEISETRSLDSKAKTLKELVQKRCVQRRLA